RACIRSAGARPPALTRREEEIGRTMSGVHCPPEAADLVYASEGKGPLLERDYSAVIEGGRCTPEQVGAMLRQRFETFAPRETARPGGSPSGRTVTTRAAWSSGSEAGPAPAAS